MPCATLDGWPMLLVHQSRPACATPMFGRWQGEFLAAAAPEPGGRPYPRSFLGPLLFGRGRAVAMGAPLARIAREQ